jgi:hypothetical protein
VSAVRIKLMEKRDFSQEPAAHFLPLYSSAIGYFASS